MLEEVDGAAGSQHPADLRERAVDVGNGAHRPCAEHAVDALVVERELGAVEADVLDGNRARGDTLGRERATNPFLHELAS